MKPVVSAFNAWFCTVLSVFAIVILSILALLYRTGHEEFTGGVSDPDDGKAVSGTIFTAVLVYVAFFLFCGIQGLMHARESRRGAIAL
ncbi:hypothetical protein BHE90_009481 [Fusarium euwallaceae]|uniref:Uncharacterized protein n=4 Tax=Fusarium solani species complex TaxID=232080 RepID=A0A3M2SN70_9HYPO|nr:hypothetical protein CDV36_001277 [Fusarium kuroshium]RSL57548.1 hypothetical protein CEP53_006444 [Fusarium sp. AF-6]RSL85247.1 hypothetical protein CEP51_003450 [Fusarium floridanum]RSM16620.1 hypothetical protein CEP52_000031 [Fusarium oligoseptatum]RTE76062.1 hypothetical protein BHE90_009481 [Fusarium euwallaceae]